MPAFKKVKKNSGKDGAPLKLDREIISKIVNILRSGAYPETAAVVAGVHKSTFYEWLKKSHEKGSDPIYKELSISVERAIEEATVRDLANIDKCAMGQEWEYERHKENVMDHEGRLIHKKGDLIYNARGNPIPIKLGLAPDWSASAWRLERRNPKHWSKTERVEHTGADGGPMVAAAETKEDKEARSKRVADMLRKLNLLDGK